MNAVTTQQEYSLHRMGAAEQDFTLRAQENADAIARYRAEFDIIVEGNDHE